MLEFLGLGSQGAHDFCESNCPEFVYDYLRGQGIWDHLFKHGFTHELFELIQQHPYSSAIIASVTAAGLTAGAVKVIRRDGKEEIVVPEGFEITRVDAPVEVKADAKKALILSSSGEFDSQGSDEEDLGVDHEVDVDAADLTGARKVEAAPVKIPASLLLQKVFDYLKRNRSESEATIARALDINQDNVEALKQLPGFPAAPSIFARLVRQGTQQGRALGLLGLPEDASYPATVEQNDHYRRICETVGMPSHTEDLGERRAIVGPDHRF